MKIAVLRANGIGDYLFAVPALEALRATYPYAEIVLLGKAWHAAFLTGRPGPVDRVIVVPPSRGVNDLPGATEDLAALEEFFAAMQHEQFDLAFQMHGGGRNSNPFTLRLGAKMTFGLRTPDAPPLDRCIPYIYYQSEVMRYLEVVALAGVRPVMLEPRITVIERDYAAARQVVPEDDAPLVVMHPGAGDSRRWWPTAKFAAVGKLLAAAGARVVVIGTEPERPLVQAVVAEMGGAGRDLCGQLSLDGLAGLLARCRLVISNDSGPLHLAAAVGTATVGIYWCGNLITAGPFTRALHRPLLAWQLTCPVCGRDCTKEGCDHRESFVADVPVDAVVTAAFELLESAPVGTNG